MSQSVRISGVVITFNEERNIERCIRSMQGVTDEILVVDSFSTDRTPETCRELGVRLVQQAFLGYIEQKNFALNLAAHEHVLSLDGDEALSENLRTAILTVKNNWQADAYQFNRFNNYCGKWMRHSGYYPDRKIRLLHRKKGQWGGTNPHDKIILQPGATLRQLPGDLLHFPYQQVGEHIEQIKRFAKIAAQAAYQKGKRPNVLVHLLLNPWFKFMKKYFLQLGFLDGYYGFVFCTLTSMLNFLKYVQLMEMYRKQPLNDTGQFVTHPAEQKKDTPVQSS